MTGRRTAAVVAILGVVLAGCTGVAAPHQPAPSGRSSTPRSSRTAGAATPAIDPNAPVRSLRTAWTLDSSTTSTLPPDTTDETRFVTAGTSVFDVYNAGVGANVRRTDRDGRVQWKQPTPGTDVCAPPRVADGVVVTCTENGYNFNSGILAAYDVESGRELWHHGGFAILKGVAAVVGTRAVSWTGAGKDFDYPHNGTLVALDLHTGKTVASTKLTQPLIALVADATQVYTYSGGSYFSGGGGAVTAYSTALHPKWKKAVPSNTNNQFDAYTPGVLLAAIAAHHTLRLTRYDANGRVLWHKTSTESITSELPVTANSFLLISGLSDVVVSLISARTGESAWQHLFTSSGATVYSVAQSGHSLYVCDGRLLIVDARTGALETASGSSPQASTCGNALGVLPRDGSTAPQDTIVEQSTSTVTALTPVLTGSATDAPEWAAPSAADCAFTAGRVRAALAKIAGGTWTLTSSAGSVPFCTYGQLTKPGLTVSIDAETQAASTASARKTQLDHLAHSGFPFGCFSESNQITELAGLPPGSFACTGSSVPPAPGLENPYEGFGATIIGRQQVTLSYDPAPATVDRQSITGKMRAAFLALRG